MLCAYLIRLWLDAKYEEKKRKLDENKTKCQDGQWKKKQIK